MGLVIRLEPSRLRMKQWRCSSLAPEVCWLMSKRPQKCNLISSVNLDRKWPKQNWFELRNISMSPCHILTAQEKSAAKCYQIKFIFAVVISNVWILVVLRESEVHLIGAGRWIKWWRLKSWPRVSVQSEVRMSNGPTVVKMTSQISPPIRDGKYLTIVQLNFVHCAHCSGSSLSSSSISELCFIFPKIQIYMKICFW